MRRPGVGVYVLAANVSAVLGYGRSEKICKIFHDCHLPDGCLGTPTKWPLVSNLCAGP